MAANESSVTMANAIREIVLPGYREGIWRNDVVLPLLRAAGMLELVAPGGEYHKWVINSSGNSSAALFTENDAAPASVAQGYVKPYVGWNHYWTWVTVTGIGEDVVKGGHFDAVSAALEMSMRDLVDLRSTTILGSSNNGLQVAIDSATTYANITRGSATYFESAESSTNSLAGLRALHRTVRDPEHVGQPNIHLVSPTVMEWYAALVGNPSATAAQNAAYRFMQSSGGGAMSMDLGLALGNMTLYGAPVVEVPDLTSTIWVMLDARAGRVKHLTIRPLNIMFHSNVGDNRLFKVTAGSAIVFEDPKSSGKLTGIS